MGRPFHVYSMSLVERLGFGTLEKLYEAMSSNDIVDWMAYDLTQEKVWRDKYQKEKEVYERQVQTKQDEADAVKSIFMNMGKKKNGY